MYIYTYIHIHIIYIYIIYIYIFQSPSDLFYLLRLINDTRHNVRTNRVLDYDVIFYQGLSCLHLF